MPMESIKLISVPPGVYSIKASFIGYKAVTIENIQVITGLTQQVDFSVPSQTIATQDVVIVSKRPLIQKSSTNAVRIVESADLETLPTRNLNVIAALQPGVVYQNNMITIRGSRA